MKQTIFVKTLMGIFCIPLICSCVDNERDLFQEPEKIPKEQFFDFDMNQSLALDIDYGFKEEYTVLFEIYDQDPIEVNDKEQSPLQAHCPARRASRVTPRCASQ